MNCYFRLVLFVFFLFVVLLFKPLSLLFKNILLCEKSENNLLSFVSLSCCLIFAILLSHIRFRSASFRLEVKGEERLYPRNHLLAFQMVEFFGQAKCKRIKSSMTNPKQFGFDPYLNLTKLPTYYIGLASLNNYYVKPPNKVRFWI